jgi:hypothetical protein
MFGPNQNNQKGMFENTRIRGELIKPYLKQLNADPMCQYPLPAPEKITIPVDWRERVQRIMREQGYKDGPWMVKEPKIGVHWRVWHHAFPNAKWIIVRRRTGDIVKSCMKTGFMRAFSRIATQRAVGVTNEKDGWIWWVNEHLDRFVDLVQAEDGPNYKIVWPHRMVNGDYQQMMETIEWLGLNWNRDILDFVEEKLWHSIKQQKQPNHGNISHG